MRIGLYGASDDLVEISFWKDGVKFYEDELGTYSEMTFRFDSAKGGAVLRIEHDGKVGWKTSVELPYGHDDREPVLPITLQMSETGYSYEAFVEYPLGDDPEATLAVEQSGVITHAWRNGRLLSKDAMLEEINSDDDAMCKHAFPRVTCSRCKKG